MKPASLGTKLLTVLAAATLAACASGGGRASSLPPLDAATCAKLATGLTSTGVSMIESFDSLYLDAQQRQGRRSPQSDSMRLDKPPAVLSGSALQSIMQRYYPPALLQAKRGGTAVVAMLVRADGVADPVRILKSSGIESLDLATVRAVQQVRFAPGIYRGCPVFAFTMMPITWNPGPAPPGAFQRE